MAYNHDSGTPTRRTRRSWFDTPPLTTLDPQLPPKPEISISKRQSFDTVETLTLTHFTNPPRLSFGKALIGRTKVRTLLLRNPHGFEQEVIVERFPYKKKFMVQQTRFTVGPEEVFNLQITWTPEEAGGFREMVQFYINDVYRLQAFLIGTAEKPKPARKTRKFPLGLGVRQPPTVVQTAALSSIRVSYSPTSRQESAELLQELTTSFSSKHENKENTGSQSYRKKEIPEFSNYSHKENCETAYNETQSEKNRIIRNDMDEMKEFEAKIFVEPKSRMSASRARFADKIEEEIVKTPTPLESTAIKAKNDTDPLFKNKRSKWHDTATLVMSPIPIHEGNLHGVTVDSFFHPNESQVNSGAKKMAKLEKVMTDGRDGFGNDQSHRLLSHADSTVILRHTFVAPQLPSAVKKLVATEDCVAHCDGSQDPITLCDGPSSLVKSNENKIIQKHDTSLAHSPLNASGGSKPITPSAKENEMTYNHKLAENLEQTKELNESQLGTPGNDSNVEAMVRQLSPRTQLDESLTLVAKMTAPLRNSDASPKEKAVLGPRLISQGQGIVSPNSFIENMKSLVQKKYADAQNDHNKKRDSPLSFEYDSNKAANILPGVRLSLLHHNSPYSLASNYRSPKRTVVPNRRSITSQFNKEEMRKIATVARTVKKDTEQLNRSGYKNSAMRDSACTKKSSKFKPVERFSPRGVQSPRRETFVFKNGSRTRTALIRKSPGRKSPLRKSPGFLKKASLQLKGKTGTKVMKGRKSDIGAFDTLDFTPKVRARSQTFDRQPNVMETVVTSPGKSVFIVDTLPRETCLSRVSADDEVEDYMSCDSSVVSMSKPSTQTTEDKNIDAIVQHEDVKFQCPTQKLDKFFPDLHSTDVYDLGLTPAALFCGTDRGLYLSNDTHSYKMKGDILQDYTACISKGEELPGKTQENKTISPECFGSVLTGHLPFSPDIIIDPARRGTITVTKSRPSDALLTAMNNRKQLFLDTPKKQLPHVVSEDDIETQENIQIRVEKHYQEIDGSMYLVVRETSDVTKRTTETFLHDLGISPLQFLTPTRLPASPDPQMSRRSTHNIKSPKVLDSSLMSKRHIDFTEVLEDNELDTSVCDPANQISSQECVQVKAVSQHPASCSTSSALNLVDYDVGTNSESGSPGNITRDSLEANKSLDSVFPESAASVTINPGFFSCDRVRGDSPIQEDSLAGEELDISFVSQTSGVDVHSHILTVSDSEDKFSVAASAKSEEEQFFDTLSERYYDALSEAESPNSEDTLAAREDEAGGCHEDCIKNQLFPNNIQRVDPLETSAKVLPPESKDYPLSSKGIAQHPVIDPNLLSVDNRAGLGANESCVDRKETLEVIVRATIDLPGLSEMSMVEEVVRSTPEAKLKKKLRRSISVDAFLDAQTNSKLKTDNERQDNVVVDHSSAPLSIIKTTTSSVSSQSLMSHTLTASCNGVSHPRQRTLQHSPAKPLKIQPRASQATIKERSKSLSNLSKQAEPRSSSKTELQRGNAVKLWNQATGKKSVAKGVAQAKLVLVKKSKADLPRHPNLYAARNMYYDERWMDKQERGFVQWLNFVLTPPDEYVAVTNKAKVDAGSLFLGSDLSAPRLAPTKEILSFRTYAARRRMNRLRKGACELYQSSSFVEIIRKIEVEVETRRIAVRKDKMAHADLGIKQKLLDLLLQYSPLWLRIGLETIFGEVLMLQSNQDVMGLSRFILTRLLASPDIASEFSHPTVPHLYKEGYVAAVSRHMIKKFLLLVYFMDRAKLSRLVDHDPCLFCKDAHIKSSKEILIEFSREILCGEGDITRHLAYLGYKVSHAQKPIDEFDFAVTNLSSDLRDGLRLCRVLELLAGAHAVVARLRMPAISRLQKVHNMEVFFKAMAERGLDLTSMPGDVLTPKNIVDGHREKTLNLLWMLIVHFQNTIHINESDLKEEIDILKKSLQLKIALQKFGALSSEHGHAVRGREETNFNMGNKMLQLIFEWCHLVCLHYGMMVENFTVSFCDGRALCFLLHHYHPSLLPLTEIKLQTTVSMQEKLADQSLSDGDLDVSLECPDSSAGTSPEMFEQLLMNERSNFKTLYDKVSVLGGVPLMLKSSDLSNTIPDEKVVSTYVTYLCARLLDIRQEVRAARLIQLAWRRKRLRRAIQDRQKRTQAAITIQHWIRPLLQKQASAVLIQKHWRMRQTRHTFKAVLAKKYSTAVALLQSFIRSTVARRRFLKLKRASVTLQKLWRGKQARRKLKLMKLERENRAAILQKSVEENKTSILRQKSEKEKGAIILHKSEELENRAFIHQQKSQEEEIAAIPLQKSEEDEAAILQKSECEGWAAIILPESNEDEAASHLRKSEKEDKDKILLQKSNEDRAAVNLQTLNEEEDRATVLLQKLNEENDRAAVLLQKINEDDDRAAVLLQKSNEDRAAVLLQNSNEEDRAAILMQKSNEDRAAVLLQKSNEDRAVVLLQKSQEDDRTVIFMQKSNEDMAAVLQKSQEEDSAAILLQKLEEEDKAAIPPQKLETQYGATIHLQQLEKEGEDRATSLLQKSQTEDGAAMLQQSERENKAAILLQNRLKSFMCFQKYLKMKGAVVVLQSHWRRTLAQKNLAAMRAERNSRAAVMIQSHVRSFRAQREFQTFRDSALIVQAAVRLWQAKRRLLLLQQERQLLQWKEKSAVKIQRCYMVYKCRQRFQMYRRAALTIQTGWRAHQMRLKFTEMRSKQTQAAILVQTFFRGFIQRKNYIVLKSATIIVQAFWRRILAERRVKKLKQQNLEKEGAAVTLQKFWRGFMHRRQYLSLKSAATIIQSCWRRKMASQLASRLSRKQNENAAVTIQRLYRGYRQRKKYKSLHGAAVIIQKHWRGRVAMKQVHRLLICETAAVTIQRIFKGYVHRKHYSILKSATVVLQSHWRRREAVRQVDRLKEQQQREHAAVSLQRHWRQKREMILVRQQYLEVKAAATLIQSWYRSFLETKRHRTDFLKLKAAVISIQSWWRGKAQNRKYQVLISSAVVIQSHFRKFHCRNNFLMLKMAAVTIQRHLRQHLEAQEVRKEFLALRYATVVIQRQYRQRLLFKRLKHEAAALILQTSYRKCRARQMFLKQKLAALTIQNYYRAWQKLKILRCHFLQKKQAACVIQAAYRTFTTQRRFRLIVKSAVTIQAAVRRFIHKRKFENMKRAAQTIQIHYRSYLERRAVRRFYERSLQCRHAASIIQNAYRVYLERKKYQQTIHSVVVMQSLVRCRIQRKKFQRLLKSTIIIQQRFRATKLSLSYREAYLQLRTSTILIQRYYRAACARRGVQQEIALQNLAARKIQALFRGWSQRQTYLMLQAATVICQRRFRARMLGLAARRHFILARKSAWVIQMEWRSFQLVKAAKKVLSDLKEERDRKIRLEMETTERLNKLREKKREDAAIIIQKFYRSRKLHQLQRNAAAAVLQRYARGYLTRRSLSNLKITFPHRNLYILSCQFGFVKLTEAASVIQNWWRVISNLKRCRVEFLAKIQAVVLIQSLVRMRSQRKTFINNLRQVISLQACIRTFLQHQSHHRSLERIVYLQRLIRGYQKMRKAREDFIQRRVSAIRIQCAVRPFLARRQLQRRQSSTLLQCGLNKSIQQLKYDQSQAYEAVQVHQSYIDQHWPELDRGAQGLAALTFHSLFKTYISRKAETRNLAATIIQKVVRNFLIRCLEHKTRAALVLQRTLRKYVKKKRMIQFKSVIIIQTCIRMFLGQCKQKKICAAVVKIQAAVRGWQARKLLADLRTRNLSVVRIQAWIRGFLVRQKILPVLRKRLAALQEQQTQHRASIRIQSMWRGFATRQKTDTKRLHQARKRLAEATRQATPEKTLGSRTSSALEFLMREKDLAHILEALMHLETSTRLSPACCEKMVAVRAVHVLYRLINSCNRSVPHMEVINYSVSILLNLAKYEKTTAAVIEPAESVPTIVELLQIYREKGAIFNNCCLLLGILGHHPQQRAHILSQALVKDRIQSIHVLALRKQRTAQTRQVTQAKLAAMKSHNCTLPVMTPSKSKHRRVQPDWALTKDNIYHFDSPLSAIMFVMDSLRIGPKM